jgi:two-component system NarL family response regulator
MRSMIRVLIADDHQVVREGLTAIINRQADLEVVGQAASGEEAIEVFREQSPDVTLMDLRLPGIDGIETIIRLRSISPTARVLVLTTYDGDEYIHRAIEAGAAGFLLKTVRREELIDAIRAAHQGRRSFPPQVASRLVEYGPRSDLTAREIEVLDLVANGKSNKEIGRVLGISEGTVKGHVSAILTKLDASDRTSAVTVALKRGLIRLR